MAITRAQTQVLLVGDMETARRAVLPSPKGDTRKVALDHAYTMYLETAEV